MKAAAPITRKLRCAVYTRKSTEEGLEQEFNSLDAQREACEAYAASQRAEGWVLVPDRYDDGGVSGATLERPALRRLLIDIEANRVSVTADYAFRQPALRAAPDFASLHLGYCRTFSDPAWRSELRISLVYVAELMSTISGVTRDVRIMT
jgi:hypothetical protein